MANRHDQARRDTLVKTLAKAKEQAENAHLYLVANERPFEDIAVVSDAMEHIDIALEKLGAAVQA